MATPTRATERSIDDGASEQALAIGSLSRSVGEHRFGRIEQVIYGRAFDEVVAQECERLNLRRVVVLTTRSIASTLGVRLQRALGMRHAATLNALPAHTPVASVLAASQAARNAKADLIVALGGGSVIDAAKAVLYSLWRGGTTPAQLLDFEAGVSAEGAACHKAAESALRIIAVPTTLSGAEFTSMAGVSNDKGRKQRLMHPLLVPRVVVLDPAAGAYTPAPLWLSTGMRAVDHAIETVCADRCDILSELAALRGIALLAEGLQRSARTPDDLDARMQCQLGMWMASIGPAAGVPMGVSHGIGHILGAEYGLPHGITSCVVMTAAMTWNRPLVEMRQQRLEAQLDLPGADAAEKIDELLRRLQLPRRLGDVGIREDSFAAIAERAMTDFFIPTNPRPVQSAADLVGLLRLAA